MYGPSYSAAASFADGESRPVVDGSIGTAMTVAVSASTWRDAPQPVCVRKSRFRDVSAANLNPLRPISRDPSGLSVN